MRYLQTGFRMPHSSLAPVRKALCSALIVEPLDWSGSSQLFVAGVREAGASVRPARHAAGSVLRIRDLSGSPAMLMNETFITLSALNSLVALSGAPRNINIVGASIITRDSGTL